MKLMTEELESQMPAIYSSNKKGFDPIVHVKFFCPWNNWTWYAIEYDKENREFFGLVVGFETELGYFSLDELEEVTHPQFGRAVGIERDLHWMQRPLSVVRKELEAAS